MGERGYQHIFIDGKSLASRLEEEGAKTSVLAVGRVAADETGHAVNAGQESDFWLSLQAGLALGVCCHVRGVGGFGC